ncbi:MAG: hypothetical protein MJZ97_10965, partial [Bacteroidales bacterium]|nr:hypothetical protein [Bacteroidales bacterium]
SPPTHNENPGQQGQGFLFYLGSFPPFSCILTLRKTSIFESTQKNPTYFYKILSLPHKSIIKNEIQYEKRHYFDLVAFCDGNNASVGPKHQWN